MAHENSTLDDICAVIGLSATVKLAAWFGGLRNLYVPAEAVEGQLLVNLIGMPAAKRMAKEWGHTHMVVPRLSGYEDEMLRHFIGRMLENGFNEREVARHMHMSKRRIQQVCRELEQAGLIKIVVREKAASHVTDDEVDDTEDSMSASRNLQRVMGSRFQVGNPELQNVI